MLYNGKEYVEAHGLDEFDYGARGYYATIMRFGTIDPKAEKYYPYSPYAYCKNNPVKNIDPNGMDVWSTTDPEEIKRAIESLLRGGSFQYNNNWTRKSDEDFLDPYGEAYSAGLNYNSRTGQLWLLDNYGVGGSIVSQLTWVPGKGFIEHAVGRYEFLRSFGYDYSQGNGANTWDYISNGASIASAYPTIKGTWAYNTAGGDIRWTGKNGNYYKLSQVKNNGGYIRSMNYAKNASRLTRGLGNGLTGLNVFASGVSTYLAISNGTDNTSTWVNLGISVGGAALTIFGAPVVVTGAAIGGTIWGIGQLVAGDEINGWIDDNFGY